MLKRPDEWTARRLLLETVSPVAVEKVPLWEAGGRVLAQDVIARENIPPFDRSPYDGYAFRSADSAGAGQMCPVTLRVLETVPAGSVPTAVVTEGTAIKVLTGAPIPEGADAVIPYEQTAFTAETVTLFAPVPEGSNLVAAGEDVKKGAVLARRGTMIDPGLAGTLAAQGISAPEVFQIPRIGVLSVGNELTEGTASLAPGKIRDSNRAALGTLIRAMGCACVDLGIVGDSAEAISERLQAGLSECDAVISTGGVSVGDYDLVPKAMERIGIRLLFRGAELKPGMACAYGLYGEKLICGLSGNPASALTNFYVIALPALRKLMGHGEPLPRQIRARLLEDFPKRSPVPRFLRGTLTLEDGVAGIRLSGAQGNVVLSSAVGCNVMARIPAGSGPVAAGTELEAFLI